VGRASRILTLTAALGMAHSLAPTAQASDPPASRMTLRELAHDVRFVITKHVATAKAVKRSCKRRSRVSFECTTGWKDKRFLYAGTLRVTHKGIMDIRSPMIV
jgi:hypothetical protein